MTITLYKLISGEEIIADDVGCPVGEAGIRLIKPIALIYSNHGDGTVSVGFAPYMPQAEDSCTLFVHAIASTAEPKENLRAEYCRATGTIITPGNPRILTS